MQMPSPSCLPFLQASLLPAFVWQSALDLWLPNLLLMLALTIMLLKATLRRIPSAAEDAAILDGCGFWRRLHQLVIPKVGPVLLILTLGLLVTGWADVSATDLMEGQAHLGSIAPNDSFLLGRGIPDGTAMAVLMVLLTAVTALLYLARRFLSLGRFTNPHM